MKLLMKTRPVMDVMLLSVRLCWVQLKLQYLMLQEYRDRAKKK